MFNKKEILICKGTGKNSVNKVANERLEITFENDKGQVVHLELFGRVKNLRDERAGIYPAYATGDGVGIVIDCTVAGKRVNLCFGNFPYTDVGIIKFINKTFKTRFGGVAVKNQMHIGDVVKLNSVLPGGVYTDPIRIRR